METAMACTAMGTALAATPPSRSLALKPSRVGGLSFNVSSGHLHFHARRFAPVRSCLPASPSGDTRADEGVAEAGAGNESVEKPSESSNEGKKKKLSSQSSWEATDVLGNDYLYRLGKESDNLNITVGAKTGMVDSLFTGNFLGQEGEFRS